jgi:hypothetical protein
METRQKIAITVFITGLAAFFYFGSEMLVRHTAWTDFQTPVGVADIFGLMSSVTLAIAGALGINAFDLVRKFNHTQNSRQDDVK